MLRADRAAHLAHNAMHDGIHLTPEIEKDFLVHAFRLAQIEMDIAIANMAERNGADAGQAL